MLFLTNDLAKLLMVPEKFFSLFSVLVIALFIVIMLLKGLSLWRSARRAQNVWFWVLLFVNTLGILEIIYLLTNRDAYVEIKKAKKAQAETQKVKEVEAKNDMPDMPAMQ